MISPTTNDQEKNSSELVVQLRFALLLRSQTGTAQFGRIHQPALRVALEMDMDEYGPMGYAFGILWVVWTKTLVDAGFFGEQQRDLSLCRKAGIRQTQFHSTETQKPKSFIIQITLLRVIPTVTLFCHSF